MGEFITLTCPSCGGKLQVSPNTSALNCLHCGTEHLVRRDAGGISLESFARCPKCKRNDRVEKISNIIRKSPTHSKLVQDFTPPTKPQLKLNPESIVFPIFLYSISGILFLVIVGFTIYITLSEIFTSGQGETLVIYSIICILPMSVLMFIFLFLGFIIHKVRRQYKAENNDRKKKYEYGFRRWEKAIKKWRNLYYCHRDDCVFILNEGTHAPVERMREYIYQDIITSVGDNSKYHVSDPALDDIPPTT